MKFVIDIPNDVYDDIQHNKGEYINTLNWAVRNGTPISNEGDLISREALKDIAYINKGNFNTVEGIREWIDNAPTITPEKALTDKLNDGIVRDCGEENE